MLESQLEVVRQAKQFLIETDNKDYQEILKPHLSGSAGMHMRHILDHYLALKNGISHKLIDYDKRNRYTESESCPQAALKQWQEIENWLVHVCQQDLNVDLQVSSEVNANKVEKVNVHSTLARELMFISSHAIHHFSLLNVIQSLRGNTTPENFGVAPATISFQREKAGKVSVANP
ncbi:hypothetical protein Q4574_16555 [Aliiglaciecola sp. 3_MG-2023]|uniref:hypothetical protein n=1 Tax=Aliiglaciecola sp. 3_MG-2023 TaxID=3062644 RepID=UPI0026E3A976|nr:hypothetical protein [Aliiglaciecola sp. 3_MG-2023]MDO6694911.1 hypothetical protein [Aliiglaciecola sp. 3_MG-2023]